MQTVVEMVFGSHLYGTSTPNSDRDFKGIFLPDKRDIYLGTIPKSIKQNTKDKHSNQKNTKDDLDFESFSLQYFIKLACQGQTIALDMLHCPQGLLIETSEIWKEVVKNRSKFYTKKLDSFVSYARNQAGKYGIKGSRLDACKVVIEYFKTKDPLTKLFEIWDELPVGEHIHKILKGEEYMDTVRKEFGDVPKNEYIHKAPKYNAYVTNMYEVCNKKMHDTFEVGYCLDIVQKIYENYGKRALLAQESKGVDWKAVSHAMRAAFQVKQILTENTITFPLREARYLTDIKLGKYPYLKISDHLETLMEEINELSKNSELPETSDIKFWNDFLVDIIDTYVIK